MGDAVASLHRSAPRAWGIQESQDALSSIGGETSYASRRRAVMCAAPYRWVSCGSRTIVDHPSDEACAWCPPHRKFRCVCAAAVPTRRTPSVVTAGDLSTVCGLSTIFCSTGCVRNAYLPTNVFPELRLRLQDRPRAARFARAVDIFGGIAANDSILVDRVLRAHGQSGAAPPFPARWAPVEVTEESFGVNNAARASARSKALLMRCSDTAGATCALDAVLGAFHRDNAKVAAVNRRFGNALHGVTSVGDAVREASVVGRSDPTIRRRNDSHRRYPEARRAVTPVLCLASAGDEPPLEDDDMDDNTAAEAGATQQDSSSRWALQVVESFFDTTAFASEEEFQQWLSSGDDIWVYTCTSRHDMLFIAEHGIQAIFTVLVAAAGKPGGSAGFHLRPLTSWSTLKQAARFGFGKMDMCGVQEGDVYLFFMRETPDSALRRASAFMSHTYQFDPSATTHTRRASALCVPYEGSLGRFIRVCLFGTHPWAEVVLPSISLWARGATDCLIPELLNEEQAGRLIGQVWDLQSPKLSNLLAIPSGMTRMRR